MLHHATFSHAGMVTGVEGGFQNVLLVLFDPKDFVNNDDALVNVKNQYMNLKFLKSNKVSQDYLL